MRVRHGIGALVVAGSLLVTAGNCARRATRPGLAPGREVAAGVTTPIAPVLSSLPDGATFAWVPPTELLSNLKQRDTESVTLGSVRLLRSDVTTLVLSRSWREVAPADADFLLTFVQIHRSGSTPPPTTTPTDVRPAGMPTCRGVQGESKGITCRPAPTMAGEASRRAYAWMTMVVKRRSDGAQLTKAVSLNPDLVVEPRAFVEPMLVLFLTREK